MFALNSLDQLAADKKVHIHDISKFISFNVEKTPLDKMMNDRKNALKQKG